MADIDSLKTSFTDLSKDEAYKLLIDVRQNRRDSYEAKQNKGRKKSTKKKKKKKKKKANKTDIKNLVGGMSKEQAQAMLDKLKNS